MLIENNARVKSAVIFAGGQSSRMGRDKSLLPFGGYSTLAEYQYRRLKKIFHRVYISTKSDKFPFECHSIYDTYSESSPLVGLISIFETLEEDELFILSVDAPFVDRDIIDALYEKSNNDSFDAIIAESPQGIEPLCGIYRRSIIPIAKKLLSQNNHRLNALLDHAKSHFVSFDNRDLFENLNHPYEYEEAKIKATQKEQ